MTYLYVYYTSNSTEIELRYRVTVNVIFRVHNQGLQNNAKRVSVHISIT